MLHPLHSVNGILYICQILYLTVNLFNYYGLVCRPAECLICRTVSGTDTLYICIIAAKELLRIRRHQHLFIVCRHINFRLRLLYRYCFTHGLRILRLCRCCILRLRTFYILKLSNVIREIFLYLLCCLLCYRLCVFLVYRLLLIHRLFRYCFLCYRFCIFLVYRLFLIYGLLRCCFLCYRLCIFLVYRLLLIHGLLRCCFLCCRFYILIVIYRLRISRCYAFKSII